MDRTLDSIELAVFERLIDIGKLLERQANVVAKEHASLKFSQYEVLLRLRNAGGELRMLDLAGLLVSTPSGLTYHLATLEKAGLAERVTAPGDPRGVIARITEQGRQMLLDMSGAQNDMIVGAVVEPLTRQDMEQLHRILGALQINLRGEATGGILPTQVHAS